MEFITFTLNSYIRELHENFSTFDNIPKTHVANNEEITFFLTRTRIWYEWKNLNYRLILPTFVFIGIILEYLPLIILEI